MIDLADIHAHIDDYLQIKEQIYPVVLPSARERHELALTIMQVHERHASDHVHKGERRG